MVARCSAHALNEYLRRSIFGLGGTSVESRWGETWCASAPNEKLEKLGAGAYSMSGVGDLGGES